MTRPSLCLSLLGPPLITLNNCPLNVDRKKAIALLSYLAVTGQVQTRDSLAALFWPESFRARANLRQTLWTLKRALENRWMEIDGEQVRLWPGYDLDVYQLDDAIVKAEAALKGESRKFDFAHLEKVVALYRDVFLASFTIPDAPEFDSWQLWQAQYLEQKLAVALQLLICIYKREREWEPAIRYNQRWIALDPLNETAHYELMNLYIIANKKTAAMRQYEQCKQLLNDELGVTPQPILVELYQSLRQNGYASRSHSLLTVQSKPQPNLPLHEIPEPGPLLPGSRMPLRPNPHFIGRENALKQLAYFLKVDSVVAVSPTFVAVTGLGGIGKTQLAVEFAYRYGRFFPGGVFWVNCSDAAAMPDEIAQCGGSDGLATVDNFEQLSLNQRIKYVQQAWQETTLRLLIFDNCEDMLLLDKWRPSIGGCRVLITSRCSRWDPALGITTLALNTLERSQSVHLLCHFLPNLANDSVTANSIAAELGDLPLALHLAGCFLARYQHVISPTTYLEQLLSQSLLHPSLLGKGTDYSPTDHDKQVARTLQLSYDRLDPDHQIDRLALDILARASYLADGELIPRSLLFSIMNQHPDRIDELLLTEDGLLRLVELGLLEEKAAGALRLHRLIAVMVRQLLVNDMVREDVELGLYQALKQEINSSGYVGPIPQLLPHLRSVIASGMSQPSIINASLNKWYGKHLEDMGNYREAQLYYDRCLVVRQKLLGEKHPDTAAVFLSLGTIYQYLDNLAEAQNCYEQAMSIYQAVLGSMHPSIAKCLTNIGMVFYKRGWFNETLDVLNKAKNIFEKSVGLEHPQAANCINNLARLLTEMGHYEQARVYYEQTLAIDKATLGGEHPYTAMSYSNLGELLEKQGDWSGATVYYEKALMLLKRNLGDEHLYVVEPLSGLGRIFHQLGDLNQARFNLEKALKIRQQALGLDYLETAFSLRDLGKLFHDMGDKAEAAVYLNQALALLSAK